MTKNIETSQSQESEGRSEVEKLIDILTGEAVEYLKTLIKELREETEKSRKKYNERLDDLDKNHKAEEEEIRELLNSTKRELENSIATYNRQILATIHAIKEDMTTQLNKTTVYFQEQVDRIDHEKTQRNELGKMLIMLGNQLIEDGKAKE